MNEQPIRVVLADDHRILLEGLRRLIDATPDVRVVGMATDAQGAIAAAQEHQPDVLVLDVAMPGGGLDVLRRVRELNLPCRTVVLTMYDEDRYAIEAVRLGASGYVPKRSADTDLLDAVRAAAAGKAHLTPAALRLLLATDNGGRTTALSRRELEVVRYTARGLSDREIGLRLDVSRKTVDTYRSRAMAKLDLHGRSALVTYALEHGLLE